MYTYNHWGNWCKEENITMEERDDFSNNFSQQPNTAMAGWSLGLGIAAMIVPIPVLDIVAGVIGIVLANKAKETGVQGLATAGLVCSIIGTIIAILFTLSFCAAI